MEEQDEVIEETNEGELRELKGALREPRKNKERTSSTQGARPRQTVLLDH